MNNPNNYFPHYKFIVTGDFRSFIQLFIPLDKDKKVRGVSIYNKEINLKNSDLVSFCTTLRSGGSIMNDVQYYMKGVFNILGPIKAEGFDKLTVYSSNKDIIDHIRKETKKLVLLTYSHTCTFEENLIEVYKSNKYNFTIEFKMDPNIGKSLVRTVFENTLYNCRLEKYCKYDINTNKLILPERYRVSTKNDSKFVYKADNDFYIEEDTIIIDKYNITDQLLHPITFRSFKSNNDADFLSDLLNSINNTKYKKFSMYAVESKL